MSAEASGALVNSKRGQAAETYLARYPFSSNAKVPNHSLAGRCDEIFGCPVTIQTRNASRKRTDIYEAKENTRLYCV